MQHIASLGQAESPRRISSTVAGIGAALIASAITVVMMTSNPSPAAETGQAITSSPAQCQIIARKLLVSTTVGGGTVRLREGNYLSAPITLTGQPQAVVFPLPRPGTVPVEEVLTIEGNASDVVITSDVTALRNVYPSVSGVRAFNVTWKPLKTC